MEPGQQSANGATSSHAINASPPRSQYTMDSTGMMTDRIAMNHPMRVSGSMPDVSGEALAPHRPDTGQFGCEGRGRASESAHLLIAEGGAGHDLDG